MNNAIIPARMIKVASATALSPSHHGTRSGSGTTTGTLRQPSLEDEVQGPGTNIHSHGLLAAWDRFVSMPRMDVGIFVPRPMGHVCKHAMDVLKLVWP